MATENGREKLKLQTNVPVEIALKFDEGKLIAGDYGDSVMYTLADERLFFAPPIVAKKITELGIVRGEMFRLLKAELTRGNRRTIEYQVSRVETAAVRAATAPVEPAAPAAPAPVQQISTASHGTDRAHDMAVEGLFRCLCVASDALAKHRTYNATKHSWDTKYTEQNILSAALSLYINASKESKSWTAA
jgi:hypothetical protein